MIKMKAYRTCSKCGERFEVGKDSSHRFRCGPCRRNKRRECQREYVIKNPGRRNRKVSPVERLQVTACRYYFNEFHVKSKKTCEMAFANAIEVTCDRVMEEAMRNRKGVLDRLLAMGTMKGIMLSPRGPVRPEEAV